MQPLPASAPDADGPRAREILDAYESLCAITGRMRQAALASDWDELIALEGQCASIFSRLTSIEAMKHFHFGAGKEMRHGVAGSQHRDGIELAHFGRGAQECFIRSQLFAAGTIEEPGGRVAASANRCLQRTQDG